jgi:hypothetical protein
VPTRRQLLFNLASASTAGVLLPGQALRPSAKPEIIPEPHCLSEESARGYRKLVQANQPTNAPVVILPASCQLSPENARDLLQRVWRGSWLILESGVAFSSPENSGSQTRTLAGVFGLRVHDPITLSRREASYITYMYPQRIMVRTFGAITPVTCATAERIAEFAGITVAARRPMGNGGGIIFLGSILGAGLLAQEREAYEAGCALLRGVG